MRSSLRVIVGPQHVREAVVGHCGFCPVSVGIKAEAKEIDWRIGNVITDQGTIRFTDLETKKRLIFFCSPVAQTFLQEYDRAMGEGKMAVEQFSKSFKPFTFMLNLDRAAQITETHHRTPLKDSERKLVRTRAKHGTPTIVGGRAIPLLPSRRRRWGIRGLEDVAKRLFPSGLPSEQQAQKDK